MGLYIKVEYRGDWWGEDELTETEYDTAGELFRALAGKGRKPWQALGRCTGRVYVDRPGSACELCGRPKGEHVGPVVSESIEPGGASSDGRIWPTGAVIPHGHHYQAQSQPVGWVFEARNPEPVNRGDTQPTGLRIAWVTVHEAPDTVTRTEHYATL